MVRVFSIGTVGMWGRQRQGGTCAEKKNFGKNKMGGQTIRLPGTLEGGSLYSGKKRAKRSKTLGCLFWRTKNGAKRASRGCSPSAAGDVAHQPPDKSVS